jgi:hypothetical protein
MSGQSATESKSKIVSCLNSLELTKGATKGGGGDPHGADHYQSGPHSKINSGKVSKKHKD